MNDQCETCAFNPRGSAGAADESTNHLKGLLAAYGPIPFWCHHTRSGGEYDWKNDPLGPMSIPPRERMLCGGWQRMVAELKKRGFFNLACAPEDRSTLRNYQRHLANEAIAQLKIFVDSPKGTSEREIERRHLTDLVRATFGKP